MRLVPLAEVEQRHAALQEHLRAQGVDAAVIVQNTDLYYLTGTIQQAHLVLPAEGEPVLFVRRDIERARLESPLESVRPLGSLRDLPGALDFVGVDTTGVLGFELDVLPVNHFRRYEAALPEARLVDVSSAIRDVRAVKSAYELSVLAEAATLAESVVREAASVLREGMTEIELSAHAEGYARRMGHQGFVRFRAFGQEMLLMHVFAGPEAAVGSYMDAPLGGRGLTPAVAQGAGSRAIRRGEPVVIDNSGVVDGYVVDQTRILSIGPLPSEWQKAFDACLEIQDCVRLAARPGMTAGELYALAAEEAAVRGYADAFMGAASNQVSFIGHGVGLEIDEPPLIARGSKRPLAADNVVAVEPKLVFTGRGAVGIENTWRVTDHGLERITFAADAVWEV